MDVSRQRNTYLPLVFTCRSIIISSLGVTCSGFRASKDEDLFLHPASRASPLPNNVGAFYQPQPRTLPDPTNRGAGCSTMKSSQQHIGYTTTKYSVGKGQTGAQAPTLNRSEGAFHSRRGLLRAGFVDRGQSSLLLRLHRLPCRLSGLHRGGLI